MGTSTTVAHMRNWFARGPTLGERMIETGGRASGFDYLRLALALTILTMHIALVTGDPAFQVFFYKGPARTLTDIVVPMFFGLGGFLVAGSLDRTKSLLTFLGLRILRIFPALWVDIMFSAAILGPLLTVVPLHVYLSAPDFHAYFLNLVGEIHYLLPGVFVGNPKPSVNAQLWTVPWDLLSYVLLSVFTVLGLYGRRRLFLAVVVVAQLALPLFLIAVRLGLRYQLSDRYFVVVSCFLAGVVFHLYRDRIRWNGALFGLSTAAIFALMWIHPHLIVLLTAPILYVTVFPGLLNPRRVWVIASGDYSYGTFLYHWQIQQALWLLVPFARSGTKLLLLSMPVTLCLAFLSWHLVEKFALAQKHRIAVLDDWFATQLPFARVAAMRSDAAAE